MGFIPECKVGLTSLNQEPPQHDKGHPLPKPQLASDLVLNILDALPVGSGTRQRCVFSPFLFNIALKVLARAISQEKQMKSIQIEK